MIRQVKPPALFSVDLSNVPAAPCSIIMASSPLLLRRQCLSPLGPSSPGSPPSHHRCSLFPPGRATTVASPYCFLFLFRPSPLPRITRPASTLPSVLPLSGRYLSHRPSVRPYGQAKQLHLSPRSPFTSRFPSSTPTPGSPMPR